MRFSRFSRFLGGASRGRAGAWCGLPAGEHARSFWLFRASRPIHQSCPRTTVCADVMRVGSRSRVVIPAPAWSKQIKDRLSGVAPYRYPPATSSRFHGHLQWMESQFTCTGRRRSLLFVLCARQQMVVCVLIVIVRIYMIVGSVKSSLGSIHPLAQRSSDRPDYLPQHFDGQLSPRLRWSSRSLRPTILCTDVGG